MAPNSTTGTTNSNSRVRVLDITFRAPPSGSVRFGVYGGFVTSNIANTYAFGLSDDPSVIGVTEDYGYIGREALLAGVSIIPCFSTIRTNLTPHTMYSLYLQASCAIASGTFTVQSGSNVPTPPDLLGYSQLVFKVEYL